MRSLSAELSRALTLLMLVLLVRPASAQWTPVPPPPSAAVTESPSATEAPAESESPPSAVPSAGARPEQKVAQNLEQIIQTNIPQIKNRYFSYVIGIDTSASYADSNRMSFTKLAIKEFLANHLVPGEAVWVFGFGPHPYKVMDATFWQIPEDADGARTAVQNLNGEISRAVQRNNDFGTDVNYAFSHALDHSMQAPLMNRLVMLFTDDYNEQAQWSRNPKNLKQLEKQLKQFGGKDLSSLLDKDRGINLRYSFVLQDTRPIKVPSGDASPGAGEDLRQLAVAAMSSPSPGTSASPAASGSPGASVSPSGSPTPSPSASPAEDEGAGSAPWIFLGVLAAVAAACGFAVTRALPITVVGESEKPAYLPLNTTFTVGGPPNDTLADFSAHLPRDPILQLSHVFPRTLKATALKSGTQKRIVTDDGQEVADVPVTVDHEVEITWTDGQTGRQHTLRILKGKPTPVGDAEAMGGGDREP